MSDVIFEMPETHCYYGLEVSSPSRAVGVDVELSEDGERAAIRSLTVERTAELRDALILHTLGEELAAKVQAVIAGAAPDPVELDPMHPGAPSLRRQLAMQAELLDSLTRDVDELKAWRESITTVGPVANELTMLSERLGLLEAKQ